MANSMTFLNYLK